MIDIKRHILPLFISLFMVLSSWLVPVEAWAQVNAGGCQSNCNNSTCKMQLGNDGRLPNACPSGRRYDVDPNCIRNKNTSANACLNTMPAASVSRVSETLCYRTNGAGGNSNPRNHYGTDYAAAAGTPVTAAADGEIVYAKPMSGGGRTIIMVHEKKCQCTAGSANSGCDTKFTTIYMHLSNYAVTGGYVSQGTLIGWVGGSNYAGGVLCDAGQKTSTCSPYSPHLHLEIYTGDWRQKGYPTLKSTSVINPLCDDIQSFCGGCSYDIEQCQDKSNQNEWEELSDEAKEQAGNYTEAPQLGTPDPSDDGEEGRSYKRVKRCELSDFKASGGCWFCPLFRVIFNTASVVALKAYRALADGVAMVVLIAFALWLSVYILRHVSAIEVKQPSKMLQEILMQTMKVVLVLIILKISFFNVIQLTLEPIFTTGMEFTRLLSGQGACSSQDDYMQNVKGYDVHFDESATGGLPISMGKGILCSIKSTQDSLQTLMAYARQAWCVAWNTNKAFIRHVIPSFPFLLTALVLAVGGLILMLAFPWCLVDCVLQMGIAAALAPAAIGAWPFKATSRYLKTIWDFFMNAMFNFVFLSIIIYIIMTVVNQFMNALNANSPDNWDFLLHPINGLAYWGVTGLKLIVVCLLGWVFLDEGKNFASKYAKAANLGDIGRKVGGLSAQAGTYAFKKAKAVGRSVGKAGLQVADHFVGSKIRHAQNAYRINQVKKHGTAITDAAGNITGYQQIVRDALGRQTRKTVSLDKDGKEVWSKTRKNLFGRTVRITSGPSLSKREILDRNGNVVSKNFKLRGNAAKYLTNDDGTINKERIDALIDGSGMSREDVLQAVTTEILKKRGITLNDTFVSQEVSFDEEGTMHLLQENLDGSTTELHMFIGGQGDQQMLTEVTTLHGDGSYESHYSNGLLNQNTTYRAGEADARTVFSLNDTYYRRYRYTDPFNSRGEFADGIDETAAMYGFNQSDRDLYTAQVASGRKQHVDSNLRSRFAARQPDPQAGETLNRNDSSRTEDLLEEMRRFNQQQRERDNDDLRTEIDERQREMNENQHTRDEDQQGPDGEP